jgi:hypothetical protein
MSQAKKEAKRVEKFVNDNKYPSYEEMRSKLEANIQLLNQYGDENHICCKIIYENPSNKDLIVKIGKEIFERGGINALQMNHAIIKYASPYATSNNIYVRSQPSIIEMYFQNVTPEWEY